MAYNFASSGRIINCGTSSVYSDMSVGAYMAWIRYNNNASSARIVSKQSLSPSTYASFVIFNAAQLLGAFRERNATANDLEVYAPLINFSVYSANKWLFVGFTWDEGGVDTDQILVMGDYSTPATEPSSYTQQVVGSGTHQTDASVNFCIGNRDVGTSQHFQGDIANARVVNQHLTVADFEMYRRLLYRPGPNCVGYWELMYPGIQPDLSGNGNNGTVTSAVRVTHVPLRWARPDAYSPALVAGDVLNRGLSNVPLGVVASTGGGHSGLHPISEGYIS